MPAKQEYIALNNVQKWVLGVGTTVAAAAIIGFGALLMGLRDDNRVTQIRLDRIEKVLEAFISTAYTKDDAARDSRVYELRLSHMTTAASVLEGRVRILEVECTRRKDPHQ